MLYFSTFVWLKYNKIGMATEYSALELVSAVFQKSFAKIENQIIFKL